MCFETESNVSRAKPWRRWREAAFATCTVWLVLQNVALLLLAAWGHPASALAAGTAFARTAITMSGQLFMLMLAAILGLALAAWLVHIPAETQLNGARGHADGRGSGEGGGARHERGLRWRPGPAPRRDE